MHWRRKEKQPMPLYQRLLQTHDNAKKTSGRVRKGYVPVLIGDDDGCVERHLVHVELLKEPRIATLLDLAAGEFGYPQSGVLRIPCEVDPFWRLIDMVSKEIGLCGECGKKHIWRRCFRVLHAFHLTTAPQR